MRNETAREDRTAETGTSTERERDIEAGNNPNGCIDIFRICNRDNHRINDRKVEMTTDERISALEARTEELEEELNFAYEELSKQIDLAVSERSYRLTLIGVMVSAVIGIIQILISLWK